MRRASALAVLLILYTTGPSRADERGFPDGLVTGRVSSVAGSTLRLFNDRLSIEAGDASVSSLTARVELRDLAVGTPVNVTVRARRMFGTTQLVAEDVSQLPSMDYFDAALSGDLEAIDWKNQTITVLGTTTPVSKDTEYKNLASDVKITTIAELPIGANTIVWLRATGESSVATRIYTDSDVRIPELRYFGTVVETSPKALRIRINEGDTITVVIDVQTQIVGTPAVGDSVVVLATRSQRAIVAVFIGHWPPR